jgi:hypothetical protein
MPDFIASRVYDLHAMIFVALDATKVCPRHNACSSKEILSAWMRKGQDAYQSAIGCV